MTSPSRLCEAIVTIPGTGDGGSRPPSSGARSRGGRAGRSVRSPRGARAPRGGSGASTRQRATRRKRGKPRSRPRTRGFSPTRAPGALPVSSGAVRLVAEKLCRSFGPRKIFGPLSFATSPGRVLGVAGRERLGEDDAREDPRRADPPLVREASGSRTSRAPAGKTPGSRRGRLDRLVRPRPRPLRRADAGREPRVLRARRRAPHSTRRRPSAGSPRSASTRSGSGRSAPGSSPPASGSGSSSPTRSSAPPPSSSSTSPARTSTRPATGRSRRSSRPSAPAGSVVLATNDPVELALADERVTL